MNIADIVGASIFVWAVFNTLLNEWREMR